MIVVAPYSYHFLNDQLLTAARLGSDGRNLPIHNALKHFGTDVHTSDFLLNNRETLSNEPVDYYSLGMLHHRELKELSNIRFRAFVVHEPPVIAPRLYKILPELTATFETVYVHNIEGDGYSLAGVDRKKLKKVFHPIPHGQVLDEFWGAGDRLNKFVVINSLQNPWLFRIVDLTSFTAPRKFKFNSPFEMLKPSFTGPEHYSMRIQAMAALQADNAIDLFGRKWDVGVSPEKIWPTYLLHRKKLMSIYRGSCESKYEVLSRYDFSLVIENSSMKGCISEKIFDCFYAGTIPVYYGPSDITDYIPQDAFIDIRRYSGWREIWRDVQNFSMETRRRYRECARDFLAQGGADRFTRFYDQVFSAT